jgi:uncharacterized protein with PIN domain
MPTFACDAMLKGLARWLRAAGYDAFWRYGIDDAELIALARAEGRVVLTGDGDMMRRKVLRDGEVPSLYIPHDLTVAAQLGLVRARFDLTPSPPRCMGCGGELAEVSKESVRDEAPPRTYRWLSRFWRCRRCAKLFWQGTHWQKIESKVRSMLA